MESRPPDAASASDEIIAGLFEHESVDYGIVAAFVLVAWCVIGAWVTSARVRREMTP